MRRRSTLAALIAVLAISVWGCSEPEVGSSTDDGLRKSIAAKLDAANIQGITVTVADGVATLAGPSADQATADRALALARETAGIKSVVNQLAVAGATAPVEPVKPVNTPDEVVTARVNQALASLPQLAGAKVTPSVTAGVATLTGTVPTEAAKSAAETATKTVAGVTSVVNNLQVVPVAVEVVPDTKITDDVNALLDTKFLELIVNVEVKDGNVTLSGAVPNRGTIVQVTNAVREVKGVKAVDTSRLTVQGGEPENERIGSPTKKP